LKFILDPHVEGLALVSGLMAPRVLGQAAFQVNFIVMTNFASREGASRVGALNYAFQLLMLPYGVLALSLSTVIFPMLSRQFDQGLFDAMRTTLARSIAPLVFLTLPAAVGLYCFRTSLVQVLFEFGAFDERSTDLVAEALGYFALALLGLSVVEATTRAFYAMQDTRTPVLAAIVVIAVNIILSAILAPRMGHGGLALSFALTSTAEMVILLVVLRGRLPGWSFSIHGSLLRSVMCAVLFLPLAWWMGDILADVTDPEMGRGIVGYMLFGFGMITAGLAYVAIAWLLGSRELYDVVTRLPFIGTRLRPFLAVRYGRAEH
jgi:putative peptidoglycan lipid II flippase